MHPRLIPDALIPLIRELGVESMLYLHGAMADPAAETTPGSAHQTGTALADFITPVALSVSCDPMEVSRESGLVYLAASALATPSGAASPGHQEQIVAFCRDRCQGQLWVEVTTGMDRLASQALFFSLGFSILPGFGKSGLRHSHPVIYHYSLHGYKSIPDWLNARFWAHPERWDLGNS